MKLVVEQSWQYVRLSKFRWHVSRLKKLVETATRELELNNHKLSEMEARGHVKADEPLLLRLLERSETNNCKLRLMSEKVNNYAAALNVEQRVLEEIVSRVFGTSDISKLPTLKEYVRLLISTTSSKGNQVSNPPLFAEYVLQLILMKKDRESLIGDLAEEYAEIATKYGVRKAKFWYHKQVFSSAVPLLWKAVRSIGTLASLGELIRRYTG